MNKLYNTLNIGAKAPFSLLHVTDIHIAAPDETDEPRIIELAEKRRNTYPFSMDVLRDIPIIAKEEHALPVITGDMLDCFSHGSLQTAKRFTEKNDCLFVAGNHDFRIFGGMEYDVPSSREKNLAAVSSIFRNDIRFFSEIINGVNIVGADDAYYRFEEFQLEALKKEIAKGLPIILFLHAPLYTPDTFDLMITEKRKYASLVNVPEEKMSIYPEKRYIQQLADEPTRRMYDYIISQPLIKAVVCGHIHKNFETVLPNGAPQLVTGTQTARILQIS